MLNILKLKRVEFFKVRLSTFLRGHILPGQKIVLSPASLLTDIRQHAGDLLR